MESRSCSPSRSIAFRSRARTTGRFPRTPRKLVNFYQLNGFLHGRRQIVAADRLRTEILGNYRLDYGTKKIDCNGFPWYAQVFMKPHIEIESDPSVWNRVESLIRAKLHPDGAAMQ